MKLKYLRLPFIAFLTFLLLIGQSFVFKIAAQNTLKQELCISNVNTTDNFKIDPLFDQQWHLKDDRYGTKWRDIKRFERFHKFGECVRIAVVDTGIEFHSDLDSSKSFAPGYDVIKGQDIQSHLQSIDTDQNQHGTIMASIIAQTTNNGKGGAGFAHNAKIIPIRVAEDSKHIDLDNVTKGVEKAVEKNVDVINISIGFDRGKLKDQTKEKFLNFKKAIHKAYRKNVVVFVAAGNSKEVSQELLELFKSPYVMAVTSHNRNGTISSFAPDKPGIRLSAPGGEGEGCNHKSITSLSSIPKEQIPNITKGILIATEKDGTIQGTECAGTSQATAQVSAAAAIIIAQFKNCSKWTGKPEICLSAYSAEDIFTILYKPEFILSKITNKIFNNAKKENPKATKEELEYKSQSTYQGLLEKAQETNNKNNIHRLDIYTSEWTGYGFITKKIPSIPLKEIPSPQTQEPKKETSKDIKNKETQNKNNQKTEDKKSSSGTKKSSPGKSSSMIPIIIIALALIVGCVIIFKLYRHRSQTR